MKTAEQVRYAQEAVDRDREGRAGRRLAICDPRYPRAVVGEPDQVDAEELMRRVREGA